MAYFPCIIGGDGGEIPLLFTSSDVIAGSYISNVDGSVIQSASSNRTDYIEVNEATLITYYSSTWGGNYSAFYDSNKTYIRNFKPAATQNEWGIVSIPANAKYMRMSWGGSTPPKSYQVTFEQP